MPEASIDHLRDEWRSIAALCDSLDADEWARPTACPGWTIKDQLSHLVAPEAAMLGRPAPPKLTEHPIYVHNAVGEMNEDAVELRRSWSGKEVLAEFKEVTSARLDALYKMSDAELDSDSWTPVGPGRYRDLLAIRAFDAWVHGQDIRDALGRLGDLDTPAAAHALQRCFLAMPYVIGKKVGPPEGSSVALEVIGPTSGHLAVEIKEGKARLAESDLLAPTASISVDFVIYTRVACGRLAPAEALGAEGISIKGDKRLGEAVIENLNFMI